MDFELLTSILTTIMVDRFRTILIPYIYMQNDVCI